MKNKKIIRKAIFGSCSHYNIYPSISMVPREMRDNIYPSISMVPMQPGPKPGQISGGGKSEKSNHNIDEKTNICSRPGQRERL